MFSQNMFTYSVINPGTFGMDDAVNMVGMMRQQWIGFQDSEGNNVAPETYLVSASAPVEFLGGGLGVNIMKDQLGFFSDVQAGLGYGRKTKFLQGELGYGLQANFINRKIDFSKFIPIDGGDPVIENTENTSDVLVDFSIGFFYKVPNQYYIGLSVANIIEAKGNTFNPSTAVAAQADRTVYLMGGYDFYFPRNPMLKLSPSVLVKSNLNNTQISVSSLLTYNNKFWGGVTYNVQTTDAFSILVGLNLKDFKMGYAYDLPMSSFNTKGSHEIMLAYRFKLSIKKKKDSYRNTRFL